MPSPFEHDVQTPVDVQNLNSNFPLAPGLDWANTEENNRIKIYLSDNGGVTVIPPGNYKWKFPVVVPQIVPSKNIWFISLCRTRECERPGDEDVSVNFPIAGFNLYEVS